MLKKYDILRCLFLEMNGNLARLAFEAGNACFHGEAALTFFCRVAERTRNAAAARSD